MRTNNAGTVVTVTDTHTGATTTTTLDAVADAIRPWITTNPPDDEDILAEVLGAVEALQDKINRGEPYDGQLSYLGVTIERADDE